MKLAIPSALLLFTTFIPSHSWAASRIGDALTTELKNEIFRAQLKEGFHFNTKAPNNLTVDGKKLKPSKLSAREAEFPKLDTGWKSGRAALYVCDDAVTFCEPKFIELSGSAPATPSAAPKSSKTSKGVNSLGFIEDDFKAALDLARKKKQLVLVDFSARWCPGCVRLESEIFPTSQFKSLTKDLVKLKIDVDRFENSVFSEKFKIAGIPTLLIMTPDQEEVARSYDFQPLSVLEPFFTSVRSDPTPIRKLSLRIGQRLLAAGDHDQALSYLSQIQPPPPELLDARVAAAEAKFKADPKAEPQYVEALQNAIAAEPKTSRSNVWRTSLVGHIKSDSEKAKIRKEGVAVADELLSDSAKLKEGTKTDFIGEFTHYESLLVAMYRADLIESSGADADVVSEGWKKAAETGHNLKITADRPGPALRYLLILTKAQLYPEADSLALALLKKEPGNPEIQRRRLKILSSQGKHEETIQLAQLCIKNSYGRNEFWVAESLAKSYVAVGRTREAKELIDRYLSRDDIEWNSIKSTRKTLEELRAKVAGA